MTLTPAVCFISREVVLSRKEALQGVKTWLNVYEDSLNNIQKALQRALQNTTQDSAVIS